MVETTDKTKETEITEEKVVNSAAAPPRKGIFLKVALPLVMVIASIFWAVHSDYFDIQIKSLLMGKISAPPSEHEAARLQKEDFVAPAKDSSERSDISAAGPSVKSVEPVGVQGVHGVSETTDNGLKAAQSVDRPLADSSSQPGSFAPKTVETEVRSPEKFVVVEHEKIQTKTNSSVKQPSAHENDQFQLPGALRVLIQNYSGVVAKWAVMVVLDDSELMKRITKTWPDGRSLLAVQLIKKLPSVVTPGSRIAIRDFACPVTTDKKKKAACPSRILYEWSESPFKLLDQKMDSVSFDGIANTCSAAAHSIKNDFASLKDVKPRILIVTAGSGQCNVKEVLRAAGKLTANETAPVDVVSIGVAPKKQPGYVKLAKQTRGMFLRVDKLEDVTNVLAQYAKTLHLKMVEKVEVKGETSVVSFSLGQETTVTPGIYSVILPMVNGINPSKREIHKVKINSGETTVVQVTIKKGTPLTKISSK
jgi:hypothetical protein